MSQSQISFFSLYCYISNSVSVFLNSLLLLILSQKGIETIRELRYFLTNISICATLFSISLLLLQPQFVTRGSMTIRIIHGAAQNLSDTVVKMISSISVISYLYFVLSFPLFFVYRSLVLNNSSIFGQFFTKRNIFLIFGVILILCCVEGSLVFYSYIPYKELFDRLNRTSEYVDFFENHTMSNGNAKLNEINTIRVNAQNESMQSFTQIENNEKRQICLIGNDYQRNSLILISDGIICACHIISFLTILISSHFILQTLKRSQGSMSKDTFMENRVLVRAVFFEASIPLWVSAPIAANSILAFVYGNSLEWQEFFPIYCLSIAPIASALCAILLIGPYRNALWNLVSLACLRKPPMVDKQDEEDEIAELP